MQALFWMEIYVNTFKTLSDKKSKNRLFRIKYVTEEKAKELLTNKKIEGYLILKDDNPKIIVHESGINQTVLKYTVEEISSTESIIKNLTKEEIKKEIAKGNYSINYEELNNKISEYLNNGEVKFNNLSNPGTFCASHSSPELEIFLYLRISVITSGNILR